MTKLVEPSVVYKDSFISALKEFQLEGRNTDLKIQDLQENFQGFLNKLKNEEIGVEIKKGYVPASTRWLVDDGEFVGQVAIRHKLNQALSKRGGHIGYQIRPSKRKKGYGSKILEKALPVARTLGISKVLITCDDRNIASWKIIEKNGGILENKIKINGEEVRRYWIY